MFLQLQQPLHYCCVMKRVSEVQVQTQTWQTEAWQKIIRFIYKEKRCADRAYEEPKPKLLATSNEQVVTYKKKKQKKKKRK